MSGLFLEDGENLFRDFWCPFSISFLTFSARPNYFKKKLTALRAVSDPDTSAWPAFKAAARAPPQPKSPPPRNPSRRRRPLPDPPPAGAPPPLARRCHPPEPLAAAAVTRTEVAAGFSRKTVRFYFETKMRFFILYQFTFFRFS